MNVNRYRIPRVGAGTEEDPFRPDFVLTNPGEQLRVEEEDGSDFICWVKSVEVPPFPVVE